ncbi:MAG: DUF2791 family P-loop domain-containing protein [Candidatus Thermoplasmatota archaeon]|nr:DUF2791 family P-loop domain-containing protein [Candidatus Thermoplasmatota archaeon]MBS3789463.1 DUF2791 family P-loop domain-containing protein [Candidatus Thermoplasmatota archaeon]
MLNINKSFSFVGRENQLQELIDILEEINKGKTYTVFIVGEPGIGKTFLIEKIKEKASSKGFISFEGTCKYGDSTPYAPFREAWEDTPLENAIQERESREVEDKSMFHANRNAYFFETAERLKEISSEKPIMLVLDDIHWADRGSLNLFHYLADRIENSPILLVGCYCPGDALPGEGFLDTKQQMSRNNLFSEFELGPLNIEETGEMISYAVDSENVPDDFIKKVHEVTQGNPLFIKESILQMLEEGIITEEDGFSVDWEEFDQPLVIQEVVRRRIFRLEDDAREILQIGSVIGKKLPYELLTHLFQKEEIKMLNAIDGLLQNRLLIEDDKDDENIYFPHNVIKQIVYDGIGEWLEKKKLHLKVAEAIRGFDTKDEEVNYHRLGHHYMKGEKFEIALKYFLKAGKQAEKVYSHEDAIDRYKKVLSLAKKKEKIEEKIEIVDIFEKIADAYSLLGRYEEARDYWYKALNDSQDTGRKQKIYSEISMTWKEQGEYEKALEMVEQGLKLEDGSFKSRAQLLDKKGWIFLRRSQYQKAEEIFKEQIRTAEKIKNSRSIAQAYHNFGTVCIYLKDFENSEKYLKKAKEIREKEEELKELIKTLNNLGSLYESIDIGSSLDYYKQAFNINKKVHDVAMEDTILNNIGRTYYHKAEFDKAIDNLLESIESKERRGNKYGISLSLVNLGAIHAEKGELDKALDYHERSLNIVEELGENYCKAINLRNLGYISSLNGELDEAQTHYQESLEASTQVGDKTQNAETHAALGRLYLRKGSIEKAEEEATQALKISKKVKSARESAIANRILGRVFWEEGEEEKGLNKLEEAESTLEKSGFRLELAKTRLYLGKFVKNKDGKKSEKYLREARDIFERNSMKPWLDILETV